MQATNEQDWLHQIKENALTDSQTYVGRNEEIATDESILHSKTSYPYSCGYQLSNI